MNKNITKKDVFLYFVNELDRSRRREVEMACKTDAQVHRCFDELKPTDDELEQEPLPKVKVDSPGFRRIAATAYLNVEREEVRDPIVP